MDKDQLSFVFAGCSWGCLYYIGVYQAMLNNYGDRLKTAKFGGSSSGTLIALGVVLEKSIDEIKELYDEMANISEKVGVMGKMSIYHEIALGRWAKTFLTSFLIHTFSCLFWTLNLNFRGIGNLETFNAECKFLITFLK